MYSSVKVQMHESRASFLGTNSDVLLWERMALSLAAKTEVLFFFMSFRRKWQPIPVLLPGKPHGWRSLVDCSLWLRVGHNWVTSLSVFTFMHWRRKWQPTPVFLPGESQGQGSLVGCRLWGCTESDTTEVT